MSNPVVLITGGLSGIGRAAAVAFAKKGAKVVVAGRHDDAGKALVKELRSLGSGRDYNRSAMKDYSAKQFSAGDLDATQRTFAALVLYLLQMGIKAEVIGLADRAGPDEMYWLSLEQAADLQVTYDPKSWTPWKIEPFKAGITASSHSTDGNTQATVQCSRRLGGQLFLTVKNWDLPYAKQMATCARDGYHSVFGAKISNQDVSASALQGGGFALRFRLPANVPFFESRAFQRSGRLPPRLYSWLSRKSGRVYTGRSASIQKLQD